MQRMALSAIEKALPTIVKALFALFASAVLLMLTSEQALAKDSEILKRDGFWIQVYYDGGDVPTKATLRSYVGTKAQLVLPKAIIYNKKTIPITKIENGAFADMDTLTKVIAPSGSYRTIGINAFYGCDNLKEVVIGDSVDYVMNGAFMECPNLKTYRFGYSGTKNPFDVGYIGYSIASNDFFPGITAYVVKDSGYHTSLAKANAWSSVKISIIASTSNPAAEANGTSYVLNMDTVDRAKQMGLDGTPIGHLASAEAADKFLTSYKKETDPRGSEFCKLCLKASKTKAKSVKLSWAKVFDAKKYAVYGAKCGKKNKLKFIQNTTKTALTIKKVGGKKLSKGMYYKFVVVALSERNEVRSTSKMVHAATSGGSVGNAKKVTTKAEKNIVSLAKGKTFRLKAKAQAKSKSIKMRKHVPVRYESSMPLIASVSSKGVITAKHAGTCYVYAFAQNGTFAKVKVTVSGVGAAIASAM